MNAEQKELIEWLDKLSDNYDQLDVPVYKRFLSKAALEIQRLAEENEKLNREKKKTLLRIAKANQECEEALGDYYTGHLAQDIMDILEGGGK